LKYLIKKFKLITILLIIRLLVQIQEKQILLIFNKICKFIKNSAN